MVNIAHGGLDRRATEAPKAPKKELEELRMKESENKGHAVTHAFTSYEHAPELHTFAEHKEAVALPKGHVLQHIAEHMGISHTIAGEEKPEHARASEMEEEEE